MHHFFVKANCKYRMKMLIFFSLALELAGEKSSTICEIVI